MAEISLQDAVSALKAADAAGNVEDATKLAGLVRQLSGGANERSIGERVVRGVALPLKGAESAVLDIVGGVPDLVARGLQMVGVPGQRPGMYTSALKQYLMPGAEKLQPENTAEELLHGAGQGAASAASFLVPGAALARGAQAGSLPQRVGQVMTTQPAMQASAGAVGGAVGEATDNPWLGLAASLAVPFGVAGAKGAASLTQKGLQSAFPGASEQVVDRNIGKTFENVDISKARARLQELQTAKEPVSLFQLGDESTKRLARATAGAPGEGGNIAAKRIAEQRAGMSERVQGDVNRAFKGDEFFAQEDKLLKGLSANAEQAYGEFRQKVPYVWSGGLADLFSGRPSMKDAIGVAMRNAAEEGRPFGITRAKDGKFMTAEDFQKGEGIQVLSSTAVDDVKRALDGIIESNKNEFTGKLNTYGRLVNKTKNEFLTAVESADESGLYKTARQQYAGDAEVIQALRDGKEFAKMDPREIRAFMGKASFAEKDAFRSGMQDAVEQSIKQTKGDKTKALFRKDEWTDQQLKAALDPKDYKILKRRIDARKQGWEDTGDVSAKSGSQTQLRLADAESMANNTMDTIGDVLKGSSLKTAIVGKILDPVMRRYQGITEQSAPAYAKKLFTGNPDEIRDMLLRIELERGQILNQANRNRGAFSGPVSSVAGAQLLPMLRDR